jgi:hypothetical protein
MKNLIWVVGILGLVILCGVFYKSRIPQNPPAKMFSQKIEEHSVLSIEVMDDCSLLLELANGKKICCKLPVNLVPNAKLHLVRFLNQSTNPRVVLMGVKGNAYIADLHVVPQGSTIDVSVVQWLKDKELVWVDPV